MMCEFCQNHEQGDTLYEPSDWDGGIGFDYIRDIKYCPICGSLLDGETKTESIIKVYNGNADKENWQHITIKPIEDELHTGQPCNGCEYSKPYIEYKCTHPSCKFEDEPQTDGYMTAEQTEDYRKMLNKAEHKVYGNIEDEPQTDEFQTSNEQVLEMALNNCKFKHNGCNNCTRDCMWRE